MASATPTYDLVLLLDTSADDAQRAKILADVEGKLAAGGSIVAKHDWGTRPLAYEIEHRTDAEYHLLQFKGSPELLETLGHDLKIADGVVRFRIVKLHPRMGEPPAPSAGPPQPAAVEAS